MSGMFRQHATHPAWRSLCLLLFVGWVLAGCATRPGPEVLNTVRSSAPGARIVTVYVATTRARETPSSNVFNDNRAQQMNYAEFRISIPPGHQPGQIEWPALMLDPATSFTTVQQTVLGRSSFEQKIAARAPRPGGSKVGLFIHGYNNNFQEALFRMAQMTADAELDGVAVLFAWPSEGQLTGYVADKDAATYSRDQLVELMTMLARNQRVSQVDVLAHSMGCWLTAESLRQLRLTGNSAVINRMKVILAAPDIDIDVFRSQLDVIGPLSPPMTLLVSRDDKALDLSRRIADARQRVGTIDVDDPRVQEAAVRAKVQIVDISNLNPTDGFNHDRYVGLSTIYRRLADTASSGPSGDFTRAGAFVLNTVGRTLSVPLNATGVGQSGQ